MHEGNTMRKITGNKPQVSSSIIIHSPLQISWNDLLHQGQTADVSIIRAKTGTFIIETLGVHQMGGLVWFDKTVQACQGPTSFIAYESGLVIFEYSHSCFSQWWFSHGLISYFIFWMQKQCIRAEISDNYNS
jgi:hypothetical protein